jgi:hypothetical protein
MKLHPRELLNQQMVQLIVRKVLVGMKQTQTPAPKKAVTLKMNKILVSLNKIKRN